MNDESIFKNSYVYGDSLGRMTGNGRFNNVNSIIVNSHRIFLPKSLKEKEQEPEIKNNYRFNNVYSSSFNKPSSYNISLNNNYLLGLIYLMLELLIYYNYKIFFL